LAAVCLILSAASAEAANRKLTIYMKAKTGAGGGLPAECIGYVDASVLTVKRLHTIDWDIKNDPDSPCDDLDKDEIDLRFKTEAVGTDENAPAPYKMVLRADGWWSKKVKGKVTDKAVDGRHGYVIFYKNQQASPDPELEVDGDCSVGCGPGGR
jgi:hypothetical protein